MLTATAGWTSAWISGRLYGSGLDLLLLTHQHLSACKRAPLRRLMCGSPDIGDRTWDLTALHNALPATPLPSAKPRSSGMKTVN